MVFEHNPEIVEALRARGRLFRAEEYEHAYPHCWRCGTPLLYYAKSSWYIRTTERSRPDAASQRGHRLAPRARQARALRQVAGGKRRLGALARALLGHAAAGLGVQSAECEERFCAGSIAELRERGAEVPDDLHRPYIDEVVVRCESCGGKMRRVEEVIDAWFDSGAMPFAQFHYPFENEEEFDERFPADYICEGQDQTRGWFYSLLAESRPCCSTAASYRATASASA